VGPACPVRALVVGLLVAGGVRHDRLATMAPAPAPPGPAAVDPGAGARAVLALGVGDPPPRSHRHGQRGRAAHTLAELFLLVAFAGDQLRRLEQVEEGTLALEIVLQPADLVLGTAVGSGTP